jgi:hypothetical protein
MATTTPALLRKGYRTPQKRATPPKKRAIDSVVTILSRLHKQNELLRDPTGKGYMWPGYVIDKLAALRSVDKPGTGNRDPKALADAIAAAKAQRLSKREK